MPIGKWDPQLNGEDEICADLIETHRAGNCRQGVCFPSLSQFLFAFTGCVGGVCQIVSESREFTWRELLMPCKCGWRL